MWRFKGKTKYASTACYPVPSDIERGNHILFDSALMTQDRVKAIEETFTVDEYGLMWDRPRPANFLRVWNAP
jgi:hypothetical protein